MEKFIRTPDLIVRMGAQSRYLAEVKFDVQRVNRLIFEGLGLVVCPRLPRTGASLRVEDAGQWRDS
jgi:hypothetical protein